MNGKDHYSSTEPLVVKAIIFYYRQSVPKKEQKAIKQQKQKYKHKHTRVVFLYIYIFCCFHNFHIK